MGQKYPYSDQHGRGDSVSLFSWSTVTSVIGKVPRFFSAYKGLFLVVQIHPASIRISRWQQQDRSSHTLIYLMPSIPITEVQITGIWTESIFFGIHLITFGFCIKALLFRENQLKSLQDVNWIMLTITVFLLANATLDVVLGFYHLLKAFVFSTGSEGPTQELTNISDWINISRVGFRDATQKLQSTYIAFSRQPQLSFKRLSATQYW